MKYRNALVLGFVCVGLTLATDSFASAKVRRKFKCCSDIAQAEEAIAPQGPRSDDESPDGRDVVQFVPYEGPCRNSPVVLAPFSELPPSVVPGVSGNRPDPVA